jgi:hypothetical protein
VQCFFPAFAKDLCTSNIIDAKKQSADRYVVETFFSRVKEFRVLSVTVPVERVWMIESAWVCALAATDLYAPLRKPSSWEETQTAISMAKAPLVDCLFKEAAGKPLPWFLPGALLSPYIHTPPVPINYNSDQILFIMYFKYVRFPFYQASIKKTNTNQKNMAFKY